VVASLFWWVQKWQTAIQMQELLGLQWRISIGWGYYCTSPCCLRGELLQVLVVESLRFSSCLFVVVKNLVNFEFYCIAVSILCGHGFLSWS
jgi:hypothetical protein